MSRLYLPTDHSDIDRALASAVAEAVESAELFVAWTLDGGAARAPEPADGPAATQTTPSRAPWPACGPSGAASRARAASPPAIRWPRRAEAGSRARTSSPSRSRARPRTP